MAIPRAMGADAGKGTGVPFFLFRRFFYFIAVGIRQEGGGMAKDAVCRTRENDRRLKRGDVFFPVRRRFFAGGGFLSCTIALHQKRERIFS
ncbi:hypothetical protein NB636_05480 [Oxalobacter aliiformigenes]|uniref:hypothetical protein n=1 Tax=Oxalobacter aliiformigenes TaxID=2946593 RepID=UPI0022AFE98A|nr:hypothetical protein [Oxalobacter aliiformigenes]MCZ4065804.1 hypothetical protein [Oxalobacter aliiformigenes]WAW00297.1 hypothetical protein NB636_05480 [Oxalobacter aliiformigenes]